MNRSLLTALLALVFATTVAAQTTWYVDDDAPNDPAHGDPAISDPDEDGSADHPFDAIQEGIAAAQPSDTVLVLDGTYTGTGNKNLDFQGKAITVGSASGDPALCIIDCEGDGRGFYFHSGEGPDAIVEGLMITNGSVEDFGGGVYCRYDSSPTLTNCTFSGNWAHYVGGGVCCFDSSPTLTDCTFNANAARDQGGGIGCSYSNPTLTNCTFSGNSAYAGGGMYNDEGSPTVMNCTISGNSADYGGGVYCWYNSSPTLTNCTISGNTAWLGGGMYNESSNPTLTNCTISGNSADYYGGGVCCWDSSPTLTNCTINGNSADYGGGVYCWENSSPTLTNCILWGDTPQEILVHSGSPVVAYCDLQGFWPGQGNIHADPLFVPGPAGCFYLSQMAAGQAIDSPCVNTGSDTAENLGLDTLTTRSDEGTDTGIVDMGYHYPVTGQPLIMGDYNRDLAVNLADFAALQNCFTGEGPMVVDPCCRIFDFEPDGDVNLADFALFVQQFDLRSRAQSASL